MTHTTAPRHCPADAIQVLSAELDRLQKAHGVRVSVLNITDLEDPTSHGDYRRRLNIGRRWTCIRINIRVIDQIGIAEALDTLRHEYAHAYCDAVYGVTGHGPQFLEFCARIGGTMSPEHCEGTDYAHAANRHGMLVYRYECKCGSASAEGGNLLSEQDFIDLDHAACPFCRQHIRQWAHRLTVSRP